LEDDKISNDVFDTARDAKFLVDVKQEAEEESTQLANF
jgi:hypothetical protein